MEHQPINSHNTHDDFGSRGRGGGGGDRTSLGSVYTMEDDFFSWFNLLVQLPWSNFLKKSIYKVFGPLTRCKSNVDQEE